MNSGDFKTMIENFNDPQIAKAGKAVLGRLRGHAQQRTRRERVSGTTDVQREMIQPAVLDEMRAQISKANGDARFHAERHAELRNAISDALTLHYQGRGDEGWRLLKTQWDREYEI